MELPGQFERELFSRFDVAGRRQVGSLVTHTIDFSGIISIKALNRAWKKFSAGKKSRYDVSEYQKRLKRNLLTLHNSLMAGTYAHDAYQPFTICDPKQRQIHKATVKDRLIHQAIVSAIEPIFERRFIFDSYSCRVGKGTHAGVTRLGLFLRKASCNKTKKVYVLKCDVRQFFASIDHQVLMKLIEKLKLTMSRRWSCCERLF